MALNKIVVAPLGTQEGPPPPNYAVLYLAGISDEYPWEIDTEESVGDLSFLDYGDVLPLFEPYYIGEAGLYLSQIGTVATGDIPSMFDRPAIVPAAVSSQLDDTGEERIHVAPLSPTRLTYITGTPASLYTKWGEGGLVVLDKSVPDWADTGATIDVYAGGSRLGSIAYVSESNWDASWTHTGYWNEVEGDGPSYTEADLTLVQGDNSHSGKQLPAWLAMRIRKPASFPQTAYENLVSITERATYVGYSITLTSPENVSYTLTQEILDGSYTWVIPENFPFDLNGAEWTASNEYGEWPCVIWSTAEVGGV